MTRRLVITALALGVLGVLAAAGGLRLLGAPEAPPIPSQLPPPSGDQQQGAFHKVVLHADEQVDGVWVDTFRSPMGLAVAKDGRVFVAEWRGAVKMWNPKTRETTTVAELDVFREVETMTEEGMLGIALDPDFQENGWIYLHYSDPEVAEDEDGLRRGILRVSRFDFDGERIRLDSERVLLETTMDRRMCCHAGGGIGFDRDGNLYVGIGDNTPPSSGAGYACLDERPGRALYDSQRTASDTSDFRGSILRIHPEPDGSYTIPEGNLFPPGTDGASPEIYVMGVRNPWRLGFDHRKRVLYWGDPGPDAGHTDARSQIRAVGREILRGRRGPPGYDEINAASEAGNYGWPYFIGPNLAYADYDYEAEASGELFVVERLVNDSPNNRGLRDLPPARSSLIHYPYAASEEYPEVGEAGRVAGAGPVYYYDESLESSCKLPPEMDHVLFIFDWMRNWIIAVHLDENEGVGHLERFLPEMTFMSPIDLEIGADGCLYVLEWGSYWGSDNVDSQLSRIEHHASGFAEEAGL